MLELIHLLFEKFIEIFLYCISALNNIESLISGSICLFGILVGFFNRESIKTYIRCKKNLKYYIPTRGQTSDPCTNEDDSLSTSTDLTAQFINKYFKDSNSQYFLILADSGMGKTTFLDNLFAKYFNKIFKGKIMIYKSLSYTKTIKEVKKIKNPEKTILLLDGFDEDPKTKKDYIDRFNKICEETEKFYKVIITCRTQFFPDKKSEPTNIERIKFDVNNKTIELYKFYISPFNNEEINDYLKKKFHHFWEHKKIKNAKELIFKCDDLMLRPMLLSYIDDLLEDDTRSYNYTFEIYKFLVEKWINRERVNKDALYIFTKKVARHIYNKNTPYINKEDINKLLKEYNIKLNDKEARSRSLLNRNVEGDYKFSHRSILEFILAGEVWDDIILRKEMYSNKYLGYDMTKKFYDEMCLKYINGPNQIKICKHFSFSELSNIDTSKDIINSHFKKSSLTNIKIKNNTINHCFFIQTLIEKSTFSDEVKIKNTIFNNSTFKHVDFWNIVFIDVDFNNITLENTTFVSANFDNCTFNEIPFEEVVLNSSHLENACLENTNFCNAKIENTYFTDAHLEGANFTNANLKNTYFTNAILDGANFTNAILEGADFTNAILDGANFTNAKLNFSIWSKDDINKFYNLLYDADFQYIVMVYCGRKYIFIMDKV